MLEKGIILIATHHPFYGRMAYNLACTIKASEEDTHITVITDDRGLSHLGEHQKDIFDGIIKLPGHIKSGFAPKVYLNELSPYEKTLFLDADMLWMHKKKPSDLFKSLENVEYTGITEGWVQGEDQDNMRKNYYHWANLKEIWEVYDLFEKKIFQWRSEVIYFTKTEKVNAFFKTAQEIYNDPKLTSIRKFGQSIPDELCINISSAIHGIEPHKVRWMPAYWHKLNNDIVPPVDELGGYYLVSFGSNWSSGSVKRLYNNICAYALKKLNRQHVFILQSKKEFLPERLKM